MNRDGEDTKGSKPDLLKLWMGEPEDAAPPRSSGLHRFLLALLAVASAVAFIVLAKYAIDILAILLGLLVAGLVLHIVGSRIAQSNLLSPGWLVIILLGAAVLAYAVLPRGDYFAGLARYVPQPVAEFFAWTESHGWGHVALLEPGPAGVPSSPAPAPAPTAATGSAYSTPTASSGSSGSQPANSVSPPVSSPALTLSASQGTSVLGEPVFFTARLTAWAEASNSVGSVRFHDGLTVLGAANVRKEGQARVASLRVSGLSVGRHEITAQLVDTLGFSSATSTPVVHVVLAAAIR